MFIRASTLLFPVLALSSVVAAAPEPIAVRTDSCSNGTLQCCGSTFSVISYRALPFLDMAVNHSFIRRLPNLTPIY